jgi:hypothetical protein
MQKELFFSGIYLRTTIKQLEADSVVELIYEYGAKWNVRIMILSRQDAPSARSVRCVAGAGAAPPEFVAGPVKFRRLLYSLESGNEIERQNARREVGPDFIPGEFDLEACNRLLGSLILMKGQDR